MQAYQTDPAVMVLLQVLRISEPEIVVDPQHVCATDSSVVEVVSYL